MLLGILQGAIYIFMLASYEIYKKIKTMLLIRIYNHHKFQLIKLFVNSIKKNSCLQILITVKKYIEFNKKLSLKKHKKKQKQKRRRCLCMHDFSLLNTIYIYDIHKRPNCGPIYIKEKIIGKRPYWALHAQKQFCHIFGSFSIGSSSSNTNYSTTFLLQF